MESTNNQINEFDTIEYKRQYDEWVNTFIRNRARSEVDFSMFIANLYKLPEDMFQLMVPAIEELPDELKNKLLSKAEVSLQDFMPTAYDMEYRNRKKYAEELYMTNKLIKAWNAIKLENNRQVAECCAELKAKGF